MPWMLKKPPDETKKKDNIWEKKPKITQKNQNKTTLNFLAIFVAERSVKGGLVDVGTES